MERNPVYIKFDIYDEKNYVIISSRKVSTFDNKILVHGENFVTLAHMTKVKAIGYQEDGIVVVEGRVTLSTESQINIEILEIHDKRDRRDHFKVKIRMDALLMLPELNDVRIRVRDLSLGGICFYSDEKLSINQRISIVLNEIKRGLVVDALVLRKEDNKTGYRYACRFVSLNNLQDREICEYLFRIQAERRK